MVNVVATNDYAIGYQVTNQITATPAEELTLAGTWKWDFTERPKGDLNGYIPYTVSGNANVDYIKADFFNDGLGNRVVFQLHYLVGGPNGTEVLTINNISETKTELQWINNELPFVPFVLDNSGADSLTGNDKADSLVGGAGDDDITANGGADFLSGGDGLDNLFGGAGDDRIFGGAESDWTYGADGNDVIDGGEGGATDYLVLDGFESDYVFKGTAQNFTATGKGFSDTVKGIEGIVFEGEIFNTGKAIATTALKFAVEEAPKPSVSIADAVVTEGGNVSLTVTLSGASTKTVSVNYATSLIAANSAASPDDFTASSGTLTFAAGETSKTIVIATTNDATDEVNEIFGVNLSNPSEATLGLKASATVTISDNDEPVVTPPIVTPPQVVFRDDAGTNNLVGNEVGNEMFGLRGNDRINGLAGDDEIHGGLGRDILTGSAGRDAFHFDTRPNKTTNWDKITDFNRRDDQIGLEERYFARLGDDVSRSEFRLGKVAKDANDFLIYDKGTGKLYYDADGSGAKAQVLFAQLTNKATINHNDFDIL